LPIRFIFAEGKCHRALTSQHFRPFRATNPIHATLQKALGKAFSFLLLIFAVDVITWVLYDYLLWAFRRYPASLQALDGHFQDKVGEWFSFRVNSVAIWTDRKTDAF
jgi:hypothetical protein